MGDSGTATTRGCPLIDDVQQVRHLKDRGGRFELMDEREAERFLRENNFFFKVKASAKCFSRYTNPGSERFGSYINLDFAYLAELTRLDHHLRKTVLSLTLDIEYYIKVQQDDHGRGGDPYELTAPFFESERERKARVLASRVSMSRNEKHFQPASE
ncbi:Abi family protein [Collinsella sp. An2]|uniref:Abi family protein n=1 Tax=Collinsella sp. An2 TaxID=1965585 RepID=UPI001181598A|nr:Abi family protein [Collinsella sp. An2]